MWQETIPLFRWIFEVSCTDTCDETCLESFDISFVFIVSMEVQGYQLVLNIFLKQTLFYTV